MTANPFVHLACPAAVSLQNYASVTLAGAKTTGPAYQSVLNVNTGNALLPINANVILGTKLMIQNVSRSAQLAPAGSVLLQKYARAMLAGT